MLYFVPCGSCYLEIVKIRFQGPDYFKAHVKWYSRPGKTFLCEERNVKIPKKATTTWKHISKDNDAATNPDSLPNL